MGKRTGGVPSLLLVAGVVGLSLASPAAGQADDMAAAAGGAKYTLSLSKDYTPSPWTNEVGWSSRALGKLGFGVKNVLLGWTDLFIEPQEELQAGGNFFKGLGTGIKDTIGNELGGVLHVLTFPITAVDVPLPEGGTQLLSS